MKPLGRHPKRWGLEIILADLDCLAGDKFAVLQCCLSNAKRGARDYRHHAKKRLLMERFFLSGLYGNFENPHLFILEYDSMIVGRCGHCVVRRWSSRIFLSTQRKVTNKKGGESVCRRAKQTNVVSWGIATVPMRPPFVSAHNWLLSRQL